MAARDIALMERFRLAEGAPARDLTDAEEDLAIDIALSTMPKFRARVFSKATEVAAEMGINLSELLE